ncbi:MAG: crossover junction endodeoxyribonuclease RuvC [Magnetococcales bacterium]|nr:crossover junction endodeoxyribonuclease RuvC [Magnetococcales bacterium]
MRVLGIDPGSNCTGWGVLEDGVKPAHVAHGCLRPPEDLPVAQRLLFLFRGLEGVIGQYAPQAAAVESVFVSHNAQSALKLGQARGALLAGLAASGLDVGEYTPLEVKKAVVGYGQAEKGQVQEMMKMLLSLPKAAPADASDALAVAWCHLHHLRWQSRGGRVA